MASGNDNLVDEFESAFQNCFTTLMNQEHYNVHDSEEIRTDVEQSIQKFLDIAKQTEAWFIQKRMVLSIHKPEQNIYDDSQELKKEILRKEMLIQKHYEKLQQWQNALRDGGTTPLQTSQQHQQMMPSSGQPPPGTPQQLMPQPNMQQAMHTMMQQQQQHMQQQPQQQGHMYPGHLAYLEQTTSNIR